MRGLIAGVLAGILLAAGIAVVGQPAVAAEPMPSCPGKIAFVASDSALQRQADTVKAIYARIGCPDVAFVGLPGRRGVTAFNAGEVQGELMRLPAVEIEYTRPFLRVAAPIVRMNGRLWARTATQAEAPGPAGFVLGVIWQEQFAQTHGGTGYAGQPDLFRAYNSGLIDRFLAEDSAVERALEEGRFATRPVPAGQPLVSASLHHYLAVEFTAVAAAITAELEQMAQDGRGLAMQ